MANIDKSRDTIDSGQTSRAGGVKGRVGDAQARVSGALGSARDRTSSATRQVGGRIEDAPIAALIGGVAIGAVLGALLPRTEKERQTLGPVGHRLGEAAAEAARAAVEAGKQELGIAQPSKSPFEAIVDKAVSAVTAAGSAAGSAAASKVAGSSGGGNGEDAKQPQPAGSKA